MNDKKPLDFFTGVMSHVNQEGSIEIKLDEVFELKDLPSCVYRAAYRLKSNSPYISAKAFFKDLSFMESMQLYNMTMLFAASQTGNFQVTDKQKQYALLISRVTLLKCTLLLSFGQGEETVKHDDLVHRIINFASMSTAHFMQLSRYTKAKYDKFSIDAPNGTDFMENPPDDPPSTTEGQPNA